jgi:1-deoxy-D-xylulose-5-phosphate synthase
MTILAPSSASELAKMLDFALSHNGPVAIRYPKDTAPLLSKNENLPLQKGEKIAIVSVGVMFQTAQDTAKLLSENGICEAVLYDARFVKPVSEELLAELAAYDFVFTIEDGAKIGGFGERIRADYAFAFPDIFPQTGTRTQLFTRYGLDAESIYKKILEVTTHGKQKKTKLGN